MEEEYKGIKESNFCDKCNEQTWHHYFESNIVGDGYTQCDVCKTKRYFKDEAVIKNKRRNDNKL